MKQKNTIDFKDALEDKYFAYALSTIVSRSLPDLRDGLKPVHRRLLYAMHELNLDPKNGFKKCARIVGDVIGKFHPHGDSSVYDALVRMAQEFSMRYPIIEGQGNFGSIDGDSQAAMRYTEAKLTPYAMLLLNDLQNDTVDFRSTYDGSDSEPIVLPAAVPNILANGAEGIAVGMASSIPPHNILELIDVTLMLVGDGSGSDVTLNDIMEVFNGPDFPGGGNLIDDHGARLSIYETGRGSFRLRSQWLKEPLERGKYQIVITHLPYQVNKRRLIEQLADLYQNKKIPFIDNFQDQSAEDIRIVLNPKSKDVEAEVIMESLYQLCDLEVKVNVNLNLLNKNSQPNVMGIKDVLFGFIEHRKEVLKRKLEFRLKIINNRIEILGGLIIAYLNLDEIIRIIRGEDEPKIVMIERWSLSEVQAESILNTKLRALRKLEEEKIRLENDQLLTEKNELEKILNNAKNFIQFIKKDLSNTRKILAKDPNSSRKTQLIELPTIDTSALNDANVEKYPMTVVLSKNGWLKAYKDHDQSKIKYRTSDEEGFILNSQSTDKIILFSSLGKFYSISALSIQQGRGDGEAIKLLFDFADHEEVVNFFNYKPNIKYCVIAKNGRGFLVNSEDIVSHTKAGKNVLSSASNDAFLCHEVLSEQDYLLMLGENRRLVVFSLSEIPTMKRGKGVVLQKIKSGMIKNAIIRPLSDVSKYLPSGSQKLELWRVPRGSLGKLVIGKCLIDTL